MYLTIYCNNNTIMVKHTRVRYYNSNNKNKYKCLKIRVIYKYDNSKLNRLIEVAELYRDAELIIKKN